MASSTPKHRDGSPAMKPTNRDKDIHDQPVAESSPPIMPRPEPIEEPKPRATVARRAPRGR